MFTIRTYVNSLDALCRTSEGFAANLLHALDTAPPSVQRYKVGWAWVKSCAASSQVVELRAEQVLRNRDHLHLVGARVDT